MPKTSPPDPLKEKVEKQAGPLGSSFEEGFPFGLLLVQNDKMNPT